MAGTVVAATAAEAAGTVGRGFGANSGDGAGAAAAMAARGGTAMVVASTLLMFLCHKTAHYVDCRHRPRGVTVSTLDPESSDRGSNPREAFASAPLSPSADDGTAARAPLS